MKGIKMIYGMLCGIALLLLILIAGVNKKMPKPKKIPFKKLSPFWFMIYIVIGSIIVIFLIVQILDSLKEFLFFMPPEH